MGWHVGRNGEVFGPFAFETLQQSILNGELHPSDLVWTDGMIEWAPASTVPGLWAPPPLPSSATAAPKLKQSSIDHDAVTQHSAAAQQQRPVDGSGGNLLLRHWRGDLSLGVSYWAIGIVVVIVTVIVSTAFQSASSSETIEPQTLGYLLGAFLLFLVLITVWQVTGVWRSATKHPSRGGKVGWAYVAKFMVILGVLRSGADFKELWPVMLQSFALVTAVDDTPPYSFRLLRDGTEIELSGGMRSGAASELQRMLDAAPTVTLVHLNSVGGRLSEGYALSKLIKSRKLSTYTSSTCVSACTLAFIAGQRRLLAHGARIGFHSASIGSFDMKDLPDINVEMRANLKAHGVPDWFVNKAMNTPAASMWYPEAKELLDAKIITGLVDRRDYGISLPKTLVLADVEEYLLKYPVYRALKEHDPTTYNRLTGKLFEGMKAGRSMTDTTQSLQVIFRTEILPKYSGIAPDSALKTYWQTQVDELIELRALDVRYCVAFAYPTAFNVDAQRYISNEVRARDLAALAELIEGAVKTPKTNDTVDVEAELERLRQMLSRKLPGALDAIGDATSAAKSPQLACDGLIEFYTQMLRLPSARAGAVMRYLGKSN